MIANEFEPQRLAAAALLVLISIAACLPFPTDPTVRVRDVMLEHVWTIVLTDDSGRIWLIQSDTSADRPPGSLGDTLSAALWTAFDGSPDQVNLVLRTSRRNGDIAWELDYLDTPAALGKGPLGSDARYWTPRSQGRATLYWQGATRSVAYDMIGGTPLPMQPMADPIPPASVQLSAPGLVSLRMDDCTELDAQSFHVLKALDLRAEIGVPSTVINRPGSCSKQLLDEMVSAGNVVESHSRTHGRTPQSFGDFYLETVGSARDLRAWGYGPHIFIQPGSWNLGPANLDTPAKLLTPYATLVRRTYLTMEAYVPRPQRVRIPPSDYLGPSPFIIGNLTPLGIDSLVRDAAAGRLWIQFMWHSADTPPAALAPRLTVIAALRDSGLVEVMPFYEALHATH